MNAQNEDVCAICLGTIQDLASIDSCKWFREGREGGTEFKLSFCLKLCR
jgi:hypothetical protein